MYEMVSPTEGARLVVLLVWEESSSHEGLTERIWTSTPWHSSGKTLSDAAALGAKVSDAAVASAQVSAIVVRLVLVLGEAVNFMVSFRQVVG
ncbi:hypothetical protein CULCOIPH002_17340 [Corynebacterium ulcerans]|uniref:Uncharacterized protein n=2 Tax=Corynebacterium ulcerans TaxID=65058 RepID=A0ABD0BMM0_CORUL|nr:hypothetical protein CULCOIPH001_13320 [Corynebacterium ulcerans]GJJ36822.1 hypothetical protein CULCOIPH002_17340 [Corynebacterium ulcerans]GJJ37380.1 hypothetical protein CULCOIPH003_00110 [Corynebacterium ulcerans]GJJ40845.1 hypothetical protein CULCOIPH004_12560 [Corynebacterium ulcerans]GJJ43213.1 hypothetical protein CULCOIPH005_14020 [Corynebacterium ulcerans]